MKKLIIIFLVSCLPLAVISQEALFYDQGQYSSPFKSSVSPLYFNMQTGMNLGTASRYGSYLQSYLSPTLTMPINKRLSVSAGVTYSYTHLNNTPIINSEGQFERYSGGVNTLTMFTSGAYRVNDKLTVTGSAFKTINPAFHHRLNPNQLQMEAQGVSVGFGYQLNENIHFGGEIRMQQGNTNFYSPFNNGYGSPFMPY